VISTEIDRCRLGGEVTGARRESVSFASTAARLRGYRRAIAAAGVPWSAVPVYEAVENSLEQGYDLARALLRARVRPTALLAMTDQLALGALRAAHEIGMHVPADVSVAGFDDIPTATLHQPALTTVQQPHERKGELAARTVLEMLTGCRQAARQHILPHALRIRGTTGRR
jgi:DNA-binding LacI/PurR family transcriptional regulator